MGFLKLVLGSACGIICVKKKDLITNCRTALCISQKRCHAWTTKQSATCWSYQSPMCIHFSHIFYKQWLWIPENFKELKWLIFQPSFCFFASRYRLLSAHLYFCSCAHLLRNRGETWFSSMKCRWNNSIFFSVCKINNLIHWKNTIII